MSIILASVLNHIHPSSRVQILIGVKESKGKLGLRLPFTSCCGQLDLRAYSEYCG